MPLFVVQNNVSPSKIGNDPDTTVSTNSRPSKKKRCLLTFGSRTRYLVLILATLCLSSLWANVLTFNFTVICMKPKNSTDRSDEDSYRIGDDNATTNGTTARHRAQNYNSTSFSNNNNSNSENINSSTTGETDFNPSHTQKSLLIGAVAVGAMISSGPLTHYFTTIGPRIIFTTVGLLTAGATALIPLAARLGFPYFLMLRGIQGVGFAACLPMIGEVTAKWAPLKRNGIFVSVLTMFQQIAPSMTMPISGNLCESHFGWPSVYYLHAIYSAVLFALFALFYRNLPDDHPCVGRKELDELAKGKSDADRDMDENIPYCSIFKTMAIWAVWIASIGNFCGYYLITLFSPTYLHKVMGYPVLKTGVSAALPAIFQLLIKIITGVSSDKLSKCSELLKVRLFNSLSFCGFSLFICLLALIPQSNPTLALVFMTTASSVLGVNTGGYYKSATLVSRRFSQAVMGIDSGVVCATMLLVTVIIEVLTDTDSVSEWATVFFSFAGIVVVTNLFFVVFARTAPASWAKDPESGS